MMKMPAYQLETFFPSSLDVHHSAKRIWDESSHFIWTVVIMTSFIGETRRPIIFSSAITNVCVVNFSCLKIFLEPSYWMPYQRKSVGQPKSQKREGTKLKNINSNNKNNVYSNINIYEGKALRFSSQKDVSYYNWLKAEWTWQRPASSWEVALRKKS